MMKIELDRELKDGRYLFIKDGGVCFAVTKEIVEEMLALIEELESSKGGEE